MKPCLRERKPSLKYKFYEEYESDDSNPAPPDSDNSDDDDAINYCHDCDVVFEDIARLHKHLLKHVKQPKVTIKRLSISTERAPIRITLKGCGSGDFAIVQSPTAALSPLFRDQGDSDQSGRGSSGLPATDKTDDEYEEKYIIPDSDPVAGASGGGSTCTAAVTKIEDTGYVEEEEVEEENTMNVSFSPNYASADMMHSDDNSLESHLSSNKTASDAGYSSGIPGAEPTPPPEPSQTPDHLMPKIRIKASGLLMAPERESPQGLTITEITEITEENATGEQEQDPFASIDNWTSAPSGVEDPLRLPDTIESDGNIISNLFTNNTDRAKDLGLSSSDSEFISLDGLSSEGNRRSNSNNAMSVYKSNNASNQSLLPASVSNALVGLPMQQLAQQVSRLQHPQAGQQQMHQQNVLINIQQFPQAPQQQQQQQQPVQPQQQVQPYGMYHQYPPAAYQPQPYGQYGQPYPQPNMYYTTAPPPPPAYPTAPAPHMPPPQPSLHPQQQQQTQPYVVQTSPQQQQPITLGAPGQIPSAQAQGQVQPYAQPQQQPQPNQNYIAQAQQHPYNQGTYGQPPVLRPPQPNAPIQQVPPPNQQQPGGNRMPAPRAPVPTGAPRMGLGPRAGPSTSGTRAPYSPRGGARPPMIRGRGTQALMSIRGRPRAPINAQQNGVRPPGMANQQGNSPVKRTPEQMAAIAAKRRRMEAIATVKVEADDDEDDCKVVSVQQKERAPPLPKIQSVQGAVPESHPDGGGVMHLSDSITLSVRPPPPPPPSPKAKSDAKQVANVLAARGITVTAAPKENKGSGYAEPVPINLNSSVRLVSNKNSPVKKDDHTPTVDLTDDIRVPAPKTTPPPSHATTNGPGATTSTVPPPLPFKCDQCTARYATNIALVKHRQQTHKTCNQMDYGVPLIDLRQAGIMSKLTNFGIYNYIPLPAANISGMFALPVISMNAVKNNVNLSSLGNSMLTLGPIRKIQKAGGAPNSQQSPPRGRPPGNPTTPTKNP